MNIIEIELFALLYGMDILKNMGYTVTAFHVYEEMVTIFYKEETT